MSEGVLFLSFFILISSSAASNSACFVIRTSSAHAGHGGQQGSLEILLESLGNQTGGHDWSAVISYLDVQPFPGDLRTVSRAFEPRDITIFAEWIIPSLTPDSRAYQHKLYALTDEAIRACPSSSTWIVATDGNMAYDKRFLFELHKIGSKVDIVAFDYYSKYQRLTGDPCERLSLPLPLKKGASRCTQNSLSPCSINLGATAFRHRRLVDEGRRFHSSIYRGEEQEGVQWEDYDGQYNDGLLASTLVDEGWSWARVLGGQCLVGEIDSPQACAALCRDGDQWGWDDAFMSRPGYFGGSCKPIKDIMMNLHSSKGVHLELLNINLSFDPASFDYGAGNASSCFEGFNCMRLKDKKRWTNRKVFGKICQARSDRKQPWAKDETHPFDAYVRERLDNQSRRKNEL